MTVGPPPGLLPLGRRGVIATAVAHAVDEVPGVDRSRSLTRSTIYAGGRVDGVSLGERSIDVYVTLNQHAYNRPLIALGDQIRELVDAALRAVDDPRISNVIIEDLFLSDIAKPRVRSATL